MKRIACLVALMALSSPASARGSLSFTFHGHRVHIAAHCRSLSCISVSGIGNRRDRDNDVATTNDPAPLPAPAQPAPAAAPPQMQPVPAPPLPAPARPPLVTAQIPAPAIARAAPPQPVTPPAPTLAAAPPAPPPAVGFETPKPQQNPTPSAPAAGPQNTVTPPPAAAQPTTPAARVAQDTESTDAGSPLGDWQTDVKNGGLVHIETCGTALCGYALDSSTRARGETVLVNMKPKNDARWDGNVYSRSSGNSYYGTMTLKQGDTLRVEACALGRFLCSGNNWTRVESNRSLKRSEQLTSQHGTPNPGS
jgi:uncharacterized protein (DUF2147 family)